MPVQARILVVDDFAPWRNQVRSLLEARADWSIVGEGSDGKEGVEKAAELQPDVVLLDLAMPVLNGIEAAKFIRQQSPKSKILFVTQEGDEDVREEAIRSGAAGYILKANAARELVDMIATALDHH